MSDDLTDEEIKTFYQCVGVEPPDDKTAEWARHCWFLFQPIIRARLAKAEADARERAARVLTRAADEIRALKPKGQ